ncbi:M61 family metallopeptidase [bacterium]|nr:M61 family metallopeptidase [bacterium]
MPARLVALVAILTSAFPARAADPINLTVDVSDVAGRVIRSRAEIPASPGPLTLLYPKWVPGTHGPTSPLADVAGFRVTAGGKDVPWARDAADPYAVNVTVPAGAKGVEVSFELLLPGLNEPPARQNTVASGRLAVLNFCDLLVYPKAAKAMDTPFRLALTLPDGWAHGSALVAENGKGTTTAFAPCTLETLIDSPLLCGLHTKAVEVGPAGGKHRVFLACDSEAGLDVPADVKAGWDKLVEQADKLFGSRPYQSYTFLLALSDRIRFRGLEHHESSDNRLPEMTLQTPHLRLYAASLFPHEYVHSWCGKFRRPAGMVVPDFQAAPDTRMLWAYEGLTNYLGWVLTARSGLINAEAARDDLAGVAEKMKNARGRAWRPLEDTGTSSHVLAGSRGAWSAWRRSLDYYDEGTLLWLEADAIIRKETDGAKSLDDFCRAFFACPPGKPAVKGYTFDDVVSGLTAVYKYDWKTHLTRRVTLPSADAPLEGIALGGWSLGYSDRPNDTHKAGESVAKGMDLTASLGVKVSADGVIGDVIPESPAAKAKLAPGAKVVAVNQRKFTPEVLKTAIAATRTGGKLELLVENGDWFSTAAIDYRGGARYPKLERTQAEPDRLGAILSPRP